MHLSRLGLLVHLVASLPWWHPSTSALPWHGSILGVLMAVVFRGVLVAVHLVDWARMGYTWCGLELAFTPPWVVTLLDGGHGQSEVKPLPSWNEGWRLLSSVHSELGGVSVVMELDAH